MLNESQAPGVADRIDRAAVMIEARRQFSIMGPLGWTFARCLSYSWTKLRRRATLARSVDGRDDAGNDN
jgi:hypothetical protein